MTSRFVYKILTTHEYQSLASSLPVEDNVPPKSSCHWQGSSLDLNDGFMHMSTDTQALYVANRYFSTAEEIYILQLQYEKVRERIKWEDPAPPEGGKERAEEEKQQLRKAAGMNAHNPSEWPPAPGFPHVYGGLYFPQDVHVVFHIRKGEEKTWDKVWPVPV